MDALQGDGRCAGAQSQRENGGGDCGLIAGTWVAYELARAGKDVVVIDRGPIGKGMTSRYTAHLTAQCDDGFHQLIGRRGRRWPSSGIKARPPQLKALRIECDFRRLDGHLFHAPGTEPGIIDQEYEATKKVGMPEGDPLCKPVKSAGTFLSANLTTGKNFAEYVAPGELSSYHELKPGEGLRARASARSPVIAT